MSRSRKKVPIAGVTGAASDRPFKTIEHGRARAATRQALASGTEPPPARKFGDPWRGEKDGKSYRPENPELLRK
ncbi:MAG: hypothetical protein KGZ61_11525 [Sandarakinorhabdus sp.]|nr:hypothetical protein [Sandarakinorhabdus sp.]